MENQTTMANALSVFNYEGNNVTFRDADGILMVNATEMAKAFGKAPSEWLRLPSTKSFLEAYSRKYAGEEPMEKSHRLYETVNGVGTWMQEPIALEFSRWLSPMFAIWCNDRIKELLTTGKVELPVTPNPIANPQVSTMEAKVRFVDLMAERLRLNEASRLGLYQQIGDEYGLTLPAYVKSEGVTKSASELLKEIGCPMSVVKFNALLVEKGYLEIVTRKSEKGGEKKFKSITEKGLPYGQNQTTPKCQKETQPHWYASRFGELFNLVTA